jgi:prephenate dehydrogenase
VIVPERVLVVGAGLLGSSVGLALRRAGGEVRLADTVARQVRLAVDLGAGEPDDGSVVDMAVLCVPPDAVAPVLAEVQAAGRASAYTDVASVKSAPVRLAREMGCDLQVFVGGHPIAGRERSGPAAARPDLFEGRPWALTPTQETSEETVAAVTTLVEACRGIPVTLDPESHDAALAVVSHAPQLVASALASRLLGAPPGAAELAGQGLRDVLRIAGSDASLWEQIAAANADPVAAVLDAVAGELAEAADGLRSGEAGVVRQLVQRGAVGRDLLPGKHGGRPLPAYDLVPVVLHDAPGQLAALFSAIREIGVNVEDVRIEHAPGAPFGVVELSVRPGASARLVPALRDRGWPVHA